MDLNEKDIEFRVEHHNDLFEQNKDIRMKQNKNSLKFGKWFKLGNTDTLMRHYFSDK